eukprot:TRINITY_DN23291_c0_g1_i2.p1 TRINITY_DN23291_c0_g1~~TRINITY_DN23291_c0_g1_i2.p1  ORF type:complete len:381 (+),score=96.23 TRINITY_DN23291_c0_g1_i2:173-1315(+)
MAQIGQQQFGQELNCEQFILEAGQVRACDDRYFLEEVCCATCRALMLELQARHEERMSELAGPMARSRSLLQRGNERFRSPPLHGRGAGMPLVALGTAGLLGELGVQAVDFSLRAGYRHLDSAIMYANHREVRLGLERSGVPREEVFLTTKIPPEMMGFEKATSAVASIRDELPGNYADLCLVHWPFSKASDDKATPEWTIIERAGTWRALEQAFKEGVCAAIGVSNYLVKHLEELQAYAEVPPSVNQLEYSPLAPWDDLNAYCKDHGILLQAFGWRRPETADSPAVQRAAAASGRSADEVLALWLLQHGQVPLYKSKNFERLLAHAELLDEAKPVLSPEQLEEIGSQRLPQYPWRYYKDDALWPWSMPVMAEVAGRQVQ